MNTTIEQPQTTKNTVQLSQNSQISSTTATSQADAVNPPVSTSDAVTRPAVIPTPPPIKPLEKGRFAMGLLLSSGGITLLLFVAMGMLQQIGLNGWVSLPLIALTSIGGVMMLGGGFGLMATAAPGFDDGEFERLMEAGNISNVCDDTSPAADSIPVETPAAAAEHSDAADDSADAV